MTHLPRTFDEIPDNIADLPDMTIDDARNMDKDVYNEMFGGANPTLVPAWAAIERREREKKWAQEQQAQVEAAERQQQMAQAASTSPANASQGDDLNWFERKAQQAGELADEAYDYGREQAGDAYQYGRRRAGEAVDATFDMAGDAYDATVDAAGEAYDYASEQVDDLVDWGQETIDDVIYGFQSMSAQEKQQFILDILGVEEARRLLNDPASADLLSTGLFLASFTPWGKGIKVVRTLGKVRKLGKARKAQAGIKSTAPIRGQKGARFAKGKEPPWRVKNKPRPIQAHDLASAANIATANFSKELAKFVGKGVFFGGWESVNEAYLSDESDREDLLLSFASGAVSGVTKSLGIAVANAVVTTFLKEIYEPGRGFSPLHIGESYMEAIEAGNWAALTPVVVSAAKALMSAGGASQGWQDFVETSINVYAPRVLDAVLPELEDVISE